MCIFPFDLVWVMLKSAVSANTAISLLITAADTTLTLTQRLSV